MYMFAKKCFLCAQFEPPAKLGLGVAVKMSASYGYSFRRQSVVHAFNRHELSVWLFNVVFHLVSKYDIFFFFSNAALFSLFHCFYVLYSFLGVVGTWPGQAFFAFLLWLDISGAF